MLAKIYILSCAHNTFKQRAPQRTNSPLGGARPSVWEYLKYYVCDMFMRTTHNFECTDIFLVAEALLCLVEPS
jgi:hypothetical protein